MGGYSPSRSFKSAGGDSDCELHIQLQPPYRFVKKLLLALVALAATAFAESPKSDVKPAVAPPGVRFERDLSYIPDGDSAQKLDLYLPEQVPDKPMPLIVHIHGGGWRGGNKYPCPVVGMVRHGYAVASVEYRFSQKALFPAQIQDCQAAIRWLRANSMKYSIDPERVGVIGASAGGHLSALVGVTGGKRAFEPIGGNAEFSDRISAVCDYFGPTNFYSVVQQAAEDKNIANIFRFNTPSDPYSSLIGTKLDDQAKSAAVSPIHYVSADCPPVLILHGTHDALVPYAQSEEFATALKQKGVAVWLQKFSGSGHGGPAFGKPAVNEMIRTFFDKHLKDPATPFALVPEADLAVEPPAPK